jgi:purine-nucleoside phosphorylase
MGDVYSQSYYEKVSESASFIRGKYKGKPKIAIILGSGLGSLVDEIKDRVEIDYRDIPHFPTTTVEGHAGKLV